MAPILGALFAILIGMLAIGPYLEYQKQSFENIRAASTASQFHQFIKATELYVRNCLTMTQGTSVSGSASKPASCQGFESLSYGQSYNIPLSSVIPDMEAEGYLPYGINATNPYGQSWYITVSQPWFSNVQAFLYSAGGQAIPNAIAPEIAAETGQEGGFVPPNGELGNSIPANTAQGAYGHWNVPIPQDISPVPTAGDLFALLDIDNNNNQGGDYLYRRQVPGSPQANTMQTDLNMGGNNITNAKTVQASAGSKTPALAEMQAVSNDSNNSAEGIVQASGSNGANGPMVSMQADNNGASITASNGLVAGSTTAPSILVEMGTSGTSDSMDQNQAGGMIQTNSPNQQNYINMQSDNNQSSLQVVGGSNSASENLAFSSIPETANTNCNPNGVASPIKPGTIAPNSDGSGDPLVCTSNSMIQSNGITLTNYEWEPIASSNNFKNTTEVSSWQGLSPIENQTGRPMMITSNCASETYQAGQASPLPISYDYILTLTVYDNLPDALLGIMAEKYLLSHQYAFPYVTDPYASNPYAGNPAPGVLSYAHTETGNNGEVYNYARPIQSLSAIVPPGKYFTYNFYTWESTTISGYLNGLPLGTATPSYPCDFMVTD